MTPTTPMKMPDMKMTVFLMLRARPEWLALDRARRNEIAGAAMEEAFGNGAVTLRFFDAEAFHGRVSDVAMIEADDPRAHYFAMERLRDSPLLSVPYFDLVDVVPAYEDGFRTFEDQAA